MGALERVPSAGRDLIPSAWSESYEFEVRLFETAWDSSGIRVAGVFGFPKSSNAPLVYGFAARHSLVAAMCAARDECIQRLGFLWGEEIPTTTPSPSPDPDFHQEYYLCPENHAALAEWLHRGHGVAPRRPIELRGRQPRKFADLTPRWLGKQFIVVKALPDGEIPLAFGAEQPIAHCDDVAGYGVHPVV
jgi:hypothetical protein